MKILVAAILLFAQINHAGAQTSREMYALASALNQLSSAVNATLLYERPSSLLSSEQLLKLSAAKNPRLLTPFEGYRLEILREDKAAVLLVCDDKARFALLEDVVCTPVLDKHHWQEHQFKRCSFTLRPVVCGR